MPPTDRPSRATIDPPSRAAFDPTGHPPIDPTSHGPVDRGNGDGHADGPRPRRNLLSRRQWLQVARVWRLTPRELDVTVLVVQRYKRAAIAAKLNIKLPTVDKHLKHVFRKFRVDDRLGLAEEVIRVRDLLRRRTGKRSRTLKRS